MIEEVVEGLGRKDVGWKRVDDRSEWAYQVASRVKELADPVADLVVIAAFGIELDHADTAEPPGVFDFWVLAELGQPLSVDSFECGDSFEDGLISKDLETRASCGASNGVGRERVAVEKGLAGVVTEEGVVDSIGGHGHCQREDASGQSLG